MYGGDSPHSKTGDLNDDITSLLTPKSFSTRIVGKRFKVNNPETEDLFVFFVPFPAPGLIDILHLPGWQYPASRDQETCPFPRMSLESPDDPCHVREVSFYSVKLLNLKLHCRLCRLLKLETQTTEIQENNMICGFYFSL